MTREEFKSSILRILKEENSDELKSYISDLKALLGECTKKMLAAYSTLGLAIVVHYIATSDPSKPLKVSGVEIPQTALFFDLYLLFLAGLFSGASCVGYLRRFIRETYDYLQIPRYKAIGAVGFHELRLPSNYVLSSELLRNDGGWIEGAISRILSLLFILCFVLFPFYYILYQAISAAPSRVEQHSYIGILILFIAVVLVFLGVLVIKLSSNIEFPIRDFEEI